MKTRCMWAGLGLLAALSAAPAMAADEHGHDHGAPASPGAAAWPRLAAVSEAFEMVGVVKGRQLAVYLDGFEDNVPVKDARVALEVGGAKVALEAMADGEFEGTLAEQPQPGVVAVKATVVAGGVTDILVGDLVMPGPASVPGTNSRGWRSYAPWAAGLLVLLAGWAWSRRHATSVRHVEGRA